MNQLPGFVQKIAPYLPSYHYGQLAWSAVGARAEPLAVSLAWLAGYTVVFLAIAMRAYRREETRKFGLARLHRLHQPVRGAQEPRVAVRAGPTSCTPSGRPFAPCMSGTLSAGIPQSVHSALNAGSPVDSRPAGRGAAGGRSQDGVVALLEELRRSRVQRRDAGPAPADSRGRGPRGRARARSAARPTAGRGPAPTPGRGSPPSRRR